MRIRHCAIPSRSRARRTGGRCNQPQWRQDFPIDWPQDHYVARRDFAKFLVLTSVAFAVGQLWIGMQNVWRKHAARRRSERSHRCRRCRSAARSSSTIQTPHDDCILIRTDDGQAAGVQPEMHAPVLRRRTEGRRRRASMPLPRRRVRSRHRPENRRPAAAPAAAHHARRPRG